MGGGGACKERNRKKKKKKSKKKKKFFYPGKVAVPPLRIYCLVCIAFFLSKER